MDGLCVPPLLLPIETDDDDDIVIPGRDEGSNSREGSSSLSSLMAS